MPKINDKILLQDLKKINSDNEFINSINLVKFIYVFGPPHLPFCCICMSHSMKTELRGLIAQYHLQLKVDTVQ